MDRSGEELGGVAGVPFAESVVEFELHEMAGDGGDDHGAGTAVDGVRELVYAVVDGPSVSVSEIGVSGEDRCYGFRYRRLLRHVQDSRAPTAAAAPHFSLLHDRCLLSGGPLNFKLFIICLFLSREGILDF